MSWTKSTQFHFQSTCCPLKVQIFLNTERIFPLRECEYGFPLKYIQFNSLQIKKKKKYVKKIKENKIKKKK